MFNLHWIDRGKTAPLLALVVALTSGCGAEGEGDVTFGEGDGENVGTATEPVFFAGTGHDYLFFMSPKTWAQAKTICEGVVPGAAYKLAVPNNTAEENFLNSEEFSHGGGGWWLGVTDQTTEAFFTQGIGGPPVNFVNWHAGEPNNVGNEDCAVDNAFNDNTWNDANCGSANKFVCERNGAAGPIPTSSLHYNAANTNSATQNTVGIPFSMNAGQTVTLGTCGLFGDMNEGTDTFLRLVSPQGQELAFNDDACNGFGSNISFVAATSGTFFVRAGCFSDKSCSGTVQISVH